MKKQIKHAAAAGVLLSALLLTGCTPQEQAFATGAAVGGIAGAALASYEHPYYYDRPYYIIMDATTMADTIITDTTTTTDTAITAGTTTTTDTATTTADATVHSRDATATTAMHPSINATIAEQLPDATMVTEIPVLTQTGAVRVPTAHHALPTVHAAVQVMDSLDTITAAERERQHVLPTEAGQCATDHLRAATLRSPPGLSLRQVRQMSPQYTPASP